MLGRCRRRVIVCDDGQPRNAAARAVHGFLTRDGAAPGNVLRIGRDELRHYDVKWKNVHVTRAVREKDSFSITLQGGAKLRSRKLILATGVADQLPAIPGIEKCYGRSVHHCPYCDAWEWRDRPLGVYGAGRGGCELAVSLLTWSPDIALFTDGQRLTGARCRELAQFRIAVHRAKIQKLQARNGMLDRVVFEDGTSVKRNALFFTAGQHQSSDLAAQLGCDFSRKGTVRTTRREGTSCPGLYVVRDASKDVQFVVVAAAEGARAAVTLNKEMEREDRG